jgi:hypothetical protein
MEHETREMEVVIFAVLGSSHASPHLQIALRLGKDFLF